MGTSVGMIEKHYSHLDAVKAVHQLRGEESRSLIETGVVDARYDYIADAKTAVRAKKSKG
jgi:hypothetical protein